MKKQVEDWILLADDDLRAAEIILNDESHLTNICAFHCQQAIEKYLKAYLVEKSVPLIKTHDLIKLNGMINEIENIGIDEKKLFAVNEIYTESRYPGELGLVPSGMPTEEEAKEFLEYAKEIKTIICRAIDGRIESC
ncbi:MAG: HEPN domain-containing protein [Chitinispirillales bacterium]|jgi:HEPN domain-containing protein|nr:HEPN domain-containing protein [Chitinispirillales bacterium]